MKKVSKKLVLGLCCSAAVFCASEVYAANGFVVRHIKVVGTQRIATGTVLNYLPVQIGEKITPADTPKIIKSLYDTGFFQSVSLEQENNTLIVNIVERSTIGTINVQGNKEIGKEPMKAFLKKNGLEKGRIFQRSALDRISRELKQAYNARGKYNARIDTKVTPLTENRVAINVNISEGRVSRIREIKIIGNHDFSQKELLADFALAPQGVLTYFSKRDQYSKAAMDASLEAMRSFYMDRGYLKFKIVSSQVLLAPDKKDVYIVIHIDEGPQYRFGGYDIVGKPILSRQKIDAMVKVKKGAVFSRKKVTESISAIGLALGDYGYGFPAINAEPRIDEKNKTVFVTFSIDPGRHVYVRRINFIGNTKTADYALRNIMRQDEGGLLSLHNIKESERQLRNVTYLKNINVKTNPVPGTNNQVDLDVQVEEAPSAEATASLGYGSANKLQFKAALTQHNFMGTGRSAGIGFNASRWGQNYSFNYYDPFYTKTGIGRGVSLYYSRVDPKGLDVSTYASNRYGGDLNYNMLLSENSSVQFGIGYQNLDIRSVGGVVPIQNFVTAKGRRFDQIRLAGGLARNTYDQMPFPTQGINQQASVLAALPANSRSLSYYKASYQAHLYQPLFRGFIFSLQGNLSYGDSFRSNSIGLPFFENYYAGGIAEPGRVRGYDSYSLGPQDNAGNSIGGNLLAIGSAGMILPYPLSRDTIRTSLFVDAGNVFAKGIPAAFTGTDSGPIRYSAGLSVEWQSPFGPLAFSLAQPLNKQPGDQVQNFQFTLSSAF